MHIDRITCNIFKKRISELLNVETLTFIQLENVFLNFRSVLSEYVDDNVFYNNPNIIHSMIIKNVHTDEAISDTFKVIPHCVY